MQRLEEMPAEKRKSIFQTQKGKIKREHLSSYFELFSLNWFYHVCGFSNLMYVIL